MQAKVGQMVMCHMIADSDNELHLMADRIGVNRKWHQKPPKHHSHYDISLGSKKKAISFGAIQITQKQAAAMCFRRKHSGLLGTPEESIQWYKDFKKDEKLKNTL